MSKKSKQQTPLTGRIEHNKLSVPDSYEKYPEVYKWLGSYGVDEKLQFWNDLAYIYDISINVESIEDIKKINNIIVEINTTLKGVQIPLLVLKNIEKEWEKNPQEPFRLNLSGKAKKIHPTKEMYRNEDFQYTKTPFVNDAAEKFEIKKVHFSKQDEEFSVIKYRNPNDIDPLPEINLEEPSPLSEPTFSPEDLSDPQPPGPPRYFRNFLQSDPNNVEFWENMITIGVSRSRSSGDSILNSIRRYPNIFDLVNYDFQIREIGDRVRVEVFRRNPDGTLEPNPMPTDPDSTLQYIQDGFFPASSNGVRRWHDRNDNIIRPIIRTPQIENQPQNTFPPIFQSRAPESLLNFNFSNEEEDKARIPRIKIDTPVHIVRNITGNIPASLITRKFVEELLIDLLSRADRTAGNGGIL